MSIHFEKKTAKAKQEIPTASLPDIIFMLLIFFMVSTVLREVDLKVMVRLPDAEAIEKIEQKRFVSYVYIGPERLEGSQLGEQRVQIDDAIVPEITEIRYIISRRLQEEPRMITSLRVDQETRTGILYDVQQELREAGALRINYSTKRLSPS